MTESGLTHVIDFTDSRDYLFERVFRAMHHFASQHKVESNGKRFAKTSMWGSWGASGWECIVRLENTPAGTRLEIEIRPEVTGWQVFDPSPRKALAHALRFIRRQEGLHPVDPKSLFLPEELEELRKTRG